MMLKDYIEMLQRKFDNYGNVEVAITEEGYYSAGRFAEVYDEAELSQINMAGGYRFVNGNPVKVPDNFKNFLVLGHSSQNY